MVSDEKCWTFAVLSDYDDVCLQMFTSFARLNLDVYDRNLASLAAFK